MLCAATSSRALTLHTSCAAVGTALSIFGALTKLLNVPLLSVTTSRVASAVGASTGRGESTGQCTVFSNPSSSAASTDDLDPPEQGLRRRLWRPARPAHQLSSWRFLLALPRCCFTHSITRPHAAIPQPGLPKGTADQPWPAHQPPPLNAAGEVWVHAGSVPAGVCWPGLVSMGRWAGVSAAARCHDVPHRPRSGGPCHRPVHGRPGRSLLLQPLSGVSLCVQGLRPHSHKLLAAALPAHWGLPMG